RAPEADEVHEAAALVAEDAVVEGDLVGELGPALEREAAVVAQAADEEQRSADGGEAQGEARVTAERAPLPGVPGGAGDHGAGEDGREEAHGGGVAQEGAGEAVALL